MNEQTYGSLDGDQVSEFEPDFNEDEVGCNVLDMVEEDCDLVFEIRIIIGVIQSTQEIWFLIGCKYTNI